MSRDLKSLLERKGKFGNLGAIDFLIQYEKRLSTKDTEGNSYVGDLSRSTTHLTANPALLDLQYAQGVLPNEIPVRHEELVSIIMPSYNNEPWLTRAINSALSQQGVNIELLVVDDGSTDGSVSLARKIAADHPNMRVISLLRNFGCYYARNMGVLNAQGSLITILDSDDIMAPDRILRQLDALKTKPDAVACNCQQRRWTADYTQAISEPKSGENSLLWKRDIVEKIGWYDTVRFSGDAEFRVRLQRTYGLSAVVSLPDEIYFTRMVDGSLTTSNGSRVFSVENKTLTISLSPERKNYADNFSVWQKKNKPKVIGGDSEMRMGFPQFSRPFPLGTPSQNASPSIGQRCVGTMASYPPRRESLQRTLESIVPQLDELILYLNGYDEIPEFVRNEKIRVYRSQDEEGDLRDNGKFFNIPNDGRSYIFTLDDDLIYPADYISRMIHYIEMFNRAAVVGVHGVIFPKGDFCHLEQRKTFYFAREFPGHFVDLLGTGTTAWHNSTLRLTLADFQTKGVCDLWFAATAARKNVPLFSVPREANWLQASRIHEESLYQEAISQPQGYFDVYNKVVAPTLNKGLVRRNMELHLVRGFDVDTLAAAGIQVREASARPIPATVLTRRTVDHREAPTYGKRAQHDQPLNFHIVVNGWNCRDYVDNCLRSIANQLPGPYTYEVSLVDDGSTDGTFEKLARLSILPSARLTRIDKNSGPAYARHLGISSIRDPETIVVLVDMDDALEPDALRVVAQRYIENPRCLMTIGNWCDQRGKCNSQPFYSAEEIDRQRVREVELFNATHLRTFRRKLYDAITEEDLYDHEGKWLETCTDVALMYPLLDQCWSWEVEFISEHIYRYTRQHGGGTLARFGKPHKLERLAFLKAKSPKSRLNIESHKKAATPLGRDV